MIGLMVFIGVFVGVIVGLRQLKKERKFEDYVRKGKYKGHHYTLLKRNPKSRDAVRQAENDRRALLDEKREQILARDAIKERKKNMTFYQRCEEWRDQQFTGPESAHKNNNPSAVTFLSKKNM